MARLKRVEFGCLSPEEINSLRNAVSQLYASDQLSTTEIGLMLGRAPSYGWKLCKRLGIDLTTPDEGKALAAPRRIKTLRRPFSGSEVDSRYLQGFSEGDLDVRKPSTKAVMVSSTTTHPAFTSCFSSLFRNYGPIYEYPTYDRLSGYRWKVAVRLDNTFSFILPDRRKDCPIFKTDPTIFFSWLAGIIDTDGSIIMERSGIYMKILLLISNEDLPLLSHIKKELQDGGYHPTGPYLQAQRGIIPSDRGIRYNHDQWGLYIQRADETKQISGLLPLKHEEKIMKKELVKNIPATARWNEFEGRVLSLRSLIKEQVNAYISKAENEYKKAGEGRG